VEKVYPWIEWQKQNNPEMADDPELRSCPFCASLHLSVTLGFDNKAARVYCRKCYANGPWICSEDSSKVISEAKIAWNSGFRSLHR
jgi:transcription elongation factor Elf1